VELDREHCPDGPVRDVRESLPAFRGRIRLDGEDWEQGQRCREDGRLKWCVNAAGFVLRPRMQERFARLAAEPS
jgi:hypothetical protein